MKKILLLGLILNSTLTLAQNRGHQSRAHQSSTDLSQERLVLKLDKELVGKQVIQIKQKLKSQYPGVQLKNLELKSVNVVAKSKGKKSHRRARSGKATLSLIVGQKSSPQKLVPASPYHFQNESSYTYNKISIKNPSYSDQGQWQIKTNGNIKVKSIVLVVAKKIQQKVKKIVIPMYGQHTKKLSVLKLKQLIKKQNPKINLQSAKLKKVTLIAKSKQGSAQATLIVGQSPNYPELVQGKLRGFHSSAPRSFSPVDLQNTTGSSQGKWLVELKGNIKVKEIMIILK